MLTTLTTCSIAMSRSYCPAHASRPVQLGILQGRVPGADALASPGQTHLLPHAGRALDGLGQLAHGAYYLLGLTCVGWGGRKVRPESRQLGSECAPHLSDAADLPSVERTDKRRNRARSRNLPQGHAESPPQTPPRREDESKRAGS